MTNPSVSSARPEQRDDFVDVNTLIETLTLDELIESAEHYFARLESWDFHLAKPFATPIETPILLGALGSAVQLLELAPGISILDFGAGSCWTSRALAQLGCRVTSMDVSATALEVGRALFERQPVVGTAYEPEFLVFDGHRIDLDSESLDRVLCFDSFHHVSNWRELLAEFHRVLAPGGLAVFSEPGPHHSRADSSQFEMRSFKVVERDIDISEIRDVAHTIGFVDVQVGVISPVPQVVSADDYLRAADRNALHELLAPSVSVWSASNTLFRLTKAGTRTRDSRFRTGLVGDLDVDLPETAATGGSASGSAVIRNVSEQVWLGEQAHIGTVRLAAHLFDGAGDLLDYDWFRVALRAAADATVEPGESVSVDFLLPPLATGSYHIEFDLVSEGVTWFALNGSRPVRRHLVVG